ncbi:unnamed protein product, partial [marine sediment metagenome]
MKKNLLVVVLVIILGLCLSSTVFAEALKVGLVFDIGGKGDKSFKMRELSSLNIDLFILILSGLVAAISSYGAMK